MQMNAQKVGEIIKAFERGEERGVGAERENVSCAGDWTLKITLLLTAA